MSGQALIAELEHALENGSHDRRVEILARVTDLFLSATQYDNEQIRLYDQVMGRLIHRIETTALTELSERLAPIDYAPTNVVRNLAMHDEIGVSGPVLSRSKRLSDDDLVAIANAKSQVHLLAISSRDRLNEPVTDVLVARGDSRVARRVAANSGASLSEGGFDLLAKRAESDEELALGLARRCDVPLRVYCALLACATDVAKTHLLAATRQENHLHVHAIVARIAGEIADEAAEFPDYAGALRNVLLRRESGNLGEDDVAYFAKHNRLGEIVAATSIIWSISIELADRIVCWAPIEALLFCCKATGFRWPTVRAILRMRTREPSPQRLLEIRDDFATLSETTARQALTSWQNCQARAPVNSRIVT